MRGILFEEMHLRKSGRIVEICSERFQLRKAFWFHFRLLSLSADICDCRSHLSYLTSSNAFSQMSLHLLDQLFFNLSQFLSKISKAGIVLTCRESFVRLSTQQKSLNDLKISRIYRDRHNRKSQHFQKASLNDRDILI